MDDPIQEDLELSANRAMIEAGFRRVPGLLELAQKAWSKMSSEERERFLHWIGEQNQGEL